MDVEAYVPNVSTPVATLLPEGSDLQDKVRMTDFGFLQADNHSSENLSPSARLNATLFVGSAIREIQAERDRIDLKLSGNMPAASCPKRCRAKAGRIR